MINKYDEIMDKLAAGELDEFVVNNNEFFLFREAWLKREDRTNFVGEAAHGGHVTYRYEKED
ncbi:hypothetical protein ACYSNR_00815 [Enterococcus sp. LJL128]